MTAFDINNPGILFTGDIEKVFSNTGDFTNKNCEVCANILDGIAAASCGEFSVIAVVTSSVAGDLKSALKALRDVCPASKIILLVQMYEEPAALKLINFDVNGARLADDYLICPTETDDLYNLAFEGRQNLKAVHSDETANNDLYMDIRIKELEKLATEDELTGLKNRRYVWEFARQIIEYAKNKNGQVTLLLFDIDNFKHYNDVYNHLAGDEILKQTAVLMRKCCRSHDIVGRIGGDEFAVIFWDDPKKKMDVHHFKRRSLAASHPTEEIFIANRLQKELKRAEFPLSGSEGKGVLAISGGLASFPRDGLTIEELFRQADNALLDAKKNGKNLIYLVGQPENGITNLNS